MVLTWSNGTKKGPNVHNPKFDICFSTRDVSPCYKCPDRYPACSDHCKKPEFLEWRAKKELVRRNRKAYEREKYAQAVAAIKRYHGR